MPENIIDRLKNRILPQWKICFFAALSVGFFAHFYKITNWLPNWDSLVFRYDSQDMLSLGRWLLSAACAVSSYYDLPWLNGILAIVFHALGTVCICEIFDVKKGVTAALIGGVVITFPTVTSVMMYNYVADGYAFAFLLSCVAALYLTREKYLIASVMITLSIAIYQAYIAVTVMLLLMYLTDELVFKKRETLHLVKKGLKFLAAGAVGVILYYAVMEILLKITGVEILEYQGMDTAAEFSGIDIANSLYVCVHKFIDSFFDFSKGLNVFVLLNCVILAITAAAYLLSALVKKEFVTIGRIILLVIYAVLLPAGAIVLVFINYSIDYHNLMKMGDCVFYLLFILLYERMDFLNIKMRSIKSWTVLTLGVMLIFNQSVIANVSYHKLQMSYEKSYGTLIRIADRIEQTDNSEICKKLLVIGALPDSKAYSANLPPDMTGTTDGYILRADDEIVGQSVLCSAINDYCGKEYKFLSGAEKREMLNKEEVKGMNFWPQKNSVAVVDDVIVVKLGAESE